MVTVSSSLLIPKCYLEAAGEVECDGKKLFALILIFHLIQNFLQVSASTHSGESRG